MNTFANFTLLTTRLDHILRTLGTQRSFNNNPLNSGTARYQLIKIMHHATLPPASLWEEAF
jgi:hypothetical protein